MSERKVLNEKTNNLRPNVAIGSSGRINDITQGKASTGRRRAAKAVGCSRCSRRLKRQGKK